MSRSYSALRTSHEKKAPRASKAAGIKPKKRLAMALKAKGAHRVVSDSPRTSFTPSPNKPPTEKSEPASRKTKPEPKLPETYSPPALRTFTTSGVRKMKQAAIQKIKDERYCEISSGRSLRSSTTFAALEVTESAKKANGNVKEAAKAAIQKIKDELSSESPPEPTVPSPTTSSFIVSKKPRSGRTLRSSTASASAPGKSNKAVIQKLKEDSSAAIELSADMDSSSGQSKKPRSGRTLRSSTTSTADRTEKIKEEPSVESSSGATLGSSPPPVISKSEKPRSERTRRSSTPAARKPATKKVKKELSDAPYHGPALLSSATSSSSNVESYSAPTLRSSRRQAILRIREELSAEATPNLASGSNAVATASELENGPPIEPEPQPEAQPEAENREEPEQGAEPEVELEHEQAQRTMTGHRYGNHRNCPICEVWGWEYPSLHIIEEDQEI